MTQQVQTRSCPLQMKPFTPTEFLKLPLLFFSTLVHPLKSERLPASALPSLCNQFVDLKNDIQRKGILGYLWNQITQRPLEVASRVGVLCGVASNVTGSIAPEHVQTVLTLLKTTGTFAKNLDFFHASSSKAIVGKGRKISAVVCFLALVPTLAGADWDSFTQARLAYSGGPCEKGLVADIEAARDCIRDGSSNFEDCLALVPPGLSREVTIFTRHISKDPRFDPVSITTISERRVCFYTTVGGQTGVTKTCVPDFQNLETRTVETVSSLPISEAQKGLQPGQTVVLLEVKSNTQPEQMCGSFFKVSPDYQKYPPTTCILTSPGKNSFASQMCLNLQNPTALTLKPLPDVKLGQPGIDEPFSLVIYNPKSTPFLNTYPDSLATKPEGEVGQPCSGARGISLWQALKTAFDLWWIQEAPCDQSQLDRKKDL